MAHSPNAYPCNRYRAQTVFEAFLDEILALQTEQGFIPHCPLRTTANGIRTLLAHRRGAHGAALESAVATLSEAFSSPSTHEYYFCEYTISRVISAVGRIAREAQAFHSVDVSPVALSAKIESLRGIGERRAEGGEHPQWRAASVVESHSASHLRLASDSPRDHL